MIYFFVVIIPVIAIGSVFLMAYRPQLMLKTSFVFAGICILIPVYLFVFHPPGSQTTNDITHYEGQTATLDNDLSSVMAATRESSYNPLYNTVSEGNIQGLQNLVASGEVMPIDKGTKVLILEKTFTSGTKVRVMEGSNNGLDVWVPAAWIK